jgi:hypothetical protein
VAEHHSIEARVGRRVGHAVRAMGPSERLAAIGVLAVLFSLPLPWYRAPISTDLVLTGAGSFSFATAALCLTGAAVLFLVSEVGDGYRPPRPLTVGGLLIAAGIWMDLVLIFLIADRPQFHFAAVNADYQLSYGIFIALGGSTAIILAGARRRLHEAAGRAADDEDHVEPARR